MKESEAIRQLCKMQGEVADRLGIETRCLCDDAKGNPGNLMMVPDEVIDELWTLIADGYLFRLIRDICRVERPKGRRINIEEIRDIEGMAMTIDEYDRVAKASGWSEEMNCTPWAWLKMKVQEGQ